MVLTAKYFFTSKIHLNDSTYDPFSVGFSTLMRDYQLKKRMKKWIRAP